MNQVHVIRHLAFEDLDCFTGVFEELGLPVHYHEAAVDDLGGLGVDDDLLVILGGPISANQVADFPFLQQEIDLARARIAADKPVLGICLGAQIIARATGAKVYPGNKEIGWSPLRLTTAGMASPLAELEPSGFEVLHWHGETFDLPPGAVQLASTEATPNQAFSLGRRTLGLQFHVEVSAAGLERWYVGHIGEIEQAAGVDLAELRAQAAARAERAADSGRRMLRRWLASVS